MQVKGIAEGEHSAILSTFIKLPFVIKTFVLSICLCRLRRNIRLCHVCYNSDLPLEGPKSHMLAHFLSGAQYSFVCLVMPIEPLEPVIVQLFMLKVYQFFRID